MNKAIKQAYEQNSNSVNLAVQFKPWLFSFSIVKIVAEYFLLAPSSVYFVFFFIFGENSFPNTAIFQNQVFF